MVLEKKELMPMLGSHSQTIQAVASIYTKDTILAVSTTSMICLYNYFRHEESGLSLNQHSLFGYLA